MTLQSDGFEARLGGRAAPVAFADPGSGPSLALFVDGEHAEADRQALANAQVLQTTSRLVGSQLEVVGLAPDDRAKSHEAVITHADWTMAGLFGDGDGGRDLQSAGNRDHVILGALGFDRLGGSAQQFVGDTRMASALHDQQADVVFNHLTRISTATLAARPETHIKD